MTNPWFVIVAVIVVLIVYGVVSAQLRARKARRLSRTLLPELADHIKTDARYKLILTSGTVFDNVRFLGISPSHDPTGQYLPFTLQQWLVVEKPDGKRVFVRPNTVKYYEEL